MNAELDTVATGLVGMAAGLKLWFLLALPPVPGFVVQGVATVLFGALSLLLNHYLKRWLERRRNRRK